MEETSSVIGLTSKTRLTSEWGETEGEQMVVWGAETGSGLWATVGTIECVILWETEDEGKSKKSQLYSGTE